MKKIKFVAILVGLSAMAASTQAQKNPEYTVTNRCSYITPRQADNWYFYNNAGIRFTDNGVELNNLPATSPNLPAGNSCAVLSDETGKLLLYTTGQKVFNGDHMNITGADNLFGDPGAAQTALIIQNPAVSQMLYVFTTDQITNTASQGLCYSRVDLSAYGSNGAVMEANIPLLQSAAPMVSGVKQANGTDYWVMTHKLGSNQFYAYEVDANGVNTNPVISSAGTAISSTLLDNEYLGTMKFSPQGDKVAFVSYGLGTIQLFSFDNATGNVGNAVSIPVTIPTTNHGPYTIEFSPDGKYLYATVVNLQSFNGSQNFLYQYDLQNGNTETKLNDVPNSDDVMSIQLARDGKIYVLRRNEFVLGVIENPNRPGLACNYNESVLGLIEAKAFNGLPNFVSSFFDIPAVNYDTKCYGDETSFTMLNTSNIDYVDWDFGDPGSTGNIITLGPVNPTHTFSKDSTFTVTYTEHFGTGSWTNSFDVTINPLPVPSFEGTFPTDTAFIADGSSLAVYANEGMYSYYWQDGSTNIGYNITAEGDYTVLVEDMNCCVSMDTLTVIKLDIKVPNAFSPDGNGYNDTFRALGPPEGITDYSLAVFNKWGQLLWETNNFLDAWDGKTGSNPVPAGLYNWRITLNVPGNIMNNGMVKLNGTLMLFR